MRQESQKFSAIIVLTPGRETRWQLGLKKLKFSHPQAWKTSDKGTWENAADSQFLFFSAYIIEKVFKTEEMSTCKAIAHYGPDLPPLQINGALWHLLHTTAPLGKITFYSRKVGEAQH